MLKNFLKYMFMIKLGYKYIYVFKQTFFHPFISLRAGYKQLSHDRQTYSNLVLKFLNIEVQVIGKLPDRNNILYAINHRSLLDILVMEHIFSQKNKNGTWIAKKELFDAFYGDFFKFSGCISVDLETKRGLLSSFKEIKKTFLKVNDFNIYIFPEGERNKKDGILSFQSGASKIAKANHLDVVPVFINDTLETVFKESPFTNKKIIKVHIGQITDYTNLENKYINFMNEAKAKDK